MAQTVHIQRLVINIYDEYNVINSSYLIFVWDIKYIIRYVCLKFAMSSHSYYILDNNIIPGI